MKRREAGFGFIIAVLGALLLVFYTGIFPMNWDVVLALPISRAVTDPGLYASEDLIISSGIRGPFHLYKLAGFLYEWGWNVDMVWQILFMVFLALSLWAVWMLAVGITGKSKVGALAIMALVLLNPLRGSLNWSSVPQQSFVTALAAMPFALFSLVFLYRNEFFLSSLLSGMVFNIHPYVGLIVLGFNVFVVLFFSKSTPIQRKILALSGCLLGLPNLLFLLQSGVTPLGGGDGGHFYEQFRLITWHAFVEDHWTEGYGWFALLMGLGVYFLPFLNDEKRRITKLLLICLTGLILVYALNIYVLKIEIFLISYMFRSTYFLKPILIILVANGLLHWIQEVNPVLWPMQEARSPLFKKFIVGLLLCVLFLAMVIPPMTMAEGFFLVACGILLYYSRQRLPKNTWLGFLLLCLGAGMVAVYFDGRLFPGYNGDGPWYAIMTGVSFASGILITVLYWNWIPDKPTLQTVRLLPFRSVFGIVLTFTIGWIAFNALWNREPAYLLPIGQGNLHDRVFVSEPMQEMAGLAEWARTTSPRGSLFVVPPGDPNFYGFRLSGERSIFITIHEINQLLFDTTILDEAQRRLDALNVKVSRRHFFDLGGFQSLQDEDLFQLSRIWGADYFVAVRGSSTAEMSQLPVVWENEFYRVFELP